MNKNDLFKALTFCMLTILFFTVSGCRDEQADERRVIRNTIATVPGWTEVYGKECYPPFDDLCVRIKMRPESERSELMKELQSALLRAKLDERSYHGRIRAVGVIWNLVLTFVSSFADCQTDANHLWEFQLNALKRFKREIARGEAEPKEGVYEHHVGIFMTREVYLDSLCARLFYAVRDGFEDSQFYYYYQSLPEKERRLWKKRIEEVAGREAVICNPRAASPSPPRYRPKHPRVKNPCLKK